MQVGGGAFPQTQGGPVIFVISDVIGGLFEGRTSGQQVITLPTTTQPLADDVRSIYGFSINALLSLWGPTRPANGVYGQLGRMVAGLIRNPAGRINQATAFMGFPLDMSIVTDLWNPANDPLPRNTWNNPLNNQLNDGDWVTCTLQLPQPIDLTSGVIGFGIWLTPSLVPNDGSGLANIYLNVVKATYTYTYEDRQGSLPSWSPGRQ